MKNFEEIKTDATIRWEGFKLRAKQKFYATKQWAQENQELAIALIPIGLVAVKGVTNAVRTVSRNVEAEREREWQETHVYDHSLGMYHKLRRPLKPSEKIEIDRRRAQGETKIQILASMGLLD